jgi:hypothetical protein
LPFAVCGNLSSTTNADGTMYSGNAAAAVSRNTTGSTPTADCT